MKIKEIGSAGKTIYALVPTFDQKLLYVGLDDPQIMVFDLDLNKIIGKHAFTLFMILYSFL